MFRSRRLKIPEGFGRPQEHEGGVLSLFENLLWNISTRTEVFQENDDLPKNYLAILNSIIQETLGTLRKQKYGNQKNQTLTKEIEQALKEKIEHLMETMVKPVPLDSTSNTLDESRVFIYELFGNIETREANLKNQENHERAVKEILNLCLELAIATNGRVHVTSKHAQQLREHLINFFFRNNRGNLLKGNAPDDIVEMKISDMFDLAGQILDPRIDDLKWDNLNSFLTQKYPNGKNKPEPRPEPRIGTYLIEDPMVSSCLRPVHVLYPNTSLETGSNEKEEHWKIEEAMEMAEALGLDPITIKAMHYDHEDNLRVGLSAYDHKDGPLSERRAYFKFKAPGYDAADYLYQSCRSREEEGYSKREDIVEKTKNGWGVVCLRELNLQKERSSDGTHLPIVHDEYTERMLKLKQELKAKYTQLLQEKFPDQEGQIPEERQTHNIAF